MVNRVCLGNRGSDVFGLYVSKNGYNVLTCTDDQLLFSSDRLYAQTIYKTTVTCPSYTWSVSDYKYVRKTITHPDFGFVPFVMVNVVSSTPVPTGDWYDPSGLSYSVNPIIYSQTQTSFCLQINSYVSAMNGNNVSQYSSYNVTIEARVLNIQNPHSPWPWPSWYTPILDI